MLERDVERHLRKRILAIGGDCEKFVSPGKRGVPDRIVTMPGGRLWFVELKRPGKDAEKQQARDHARRRAMGFDVRVLDTKEKVNAFVEEIDGPASNASGKTEVDGAAR